MSSIAFPGETFAWSYGITLQSDEQKKFHPVKGLQDDSTTLPGELKILAQKSVGIIYALRKQKPKPLGSGIVVRVFDDAEDDLLYSRLLCSNAATKEYPEILGIILTA